MNQIRSTMSPMRLVSAISNIDVHITELFRIFIFKGILTPAAYLLPKDWALALAKVLSLPLVVFPDPGIKAYRSMKRLFGGRRYHSFQLAWGWIARPFQDFVIFTRVLNGREDISNWKIVERNVEEIARLRETGQSFIVATGHFSRAAYLAVVCPRVTPGNFILSSLSVPVQLNRPQEFRLRIQFGTLLKGTSLASMVWQRPFEMAFTNTGQSAARLLYERLSKPGNVVSISVDAPWPRGVSGSFCRPFAGMKDRSFSMGAARLAKLCKCPIVSCVCWREHDGTIFLQWGSPILNVSNEIDTMNQLIDTVEAAIAERPTQYVMDIGHERRWNPLLGRWEILPD